MKNKILLAIATIRVLAVCAFIALGGLSHGFEGKDENAERVFSLWTQISDYGLLYQMGYPVDMMEVYGLARDLDSACILYQGVDYNALKCIRSASLSVQGY